MSLTRRTFLKNTAMTGAALSVGLASLRPAKPGAACLRPPGALSEKDFLATCIRCGRCGDACPNQCITSMTRQNTKQFSIHPGRGDEGTPVIFPRQQACNLCASSKEGRLLCTDACPSGALQIVEKKTEDIQKKVSMGKAEVDKNLCYSYNGSSCGVCVRACPFEGKALKAGFFEKPIVDESFCVGCGLCERACIRYPQAISVLPQAERKSV